MPKTAGYSVIVDPDKRGPQEFDLLRCAHCDTTKFYQTQANFSKVGAICYQCWQPVCSDCTAKKMICTPVAVKLAAMEGDPHAIKRMRQQYGL